MVRLVFRPYTQIRRTICTSVSLRASTRVSPGFTLPRHSSPSFGSQHMCSAQTALRRSWPVGGAQVAPDTFIPHTSLGARILAHVYGLLGPCFKTGRTKPCAPTHRFNQHHAGTLKPRGVQAHRLASSGTQVMVGLRIEKSGPHSSHHQAAPKCRPSGDNTALSTVLAAYDG